HVDDVPAAFFAAHVAVVASTEPEAFGRAAAEAQAMGCPVIATAIGAPPETVRAEPHVPLGETTGWLVPPGDAAALADRINTALALMDDERSAIARRARAHVLRNFSLADMKGATLAVYDQLIGSNLSGRSSRLERSHSRNAGA
ncbi:MAG TPA: glycosyltransferase, partial [Hyphomicrobiaceae bacterium]|nr:glycosyltransferase [Hyphomicrobiaceae bacterium]